MTEENYFTELTKVEAPVEKKGPHKLNYVSWADAWKVFKERYSRAWFKVYENENGMPYFADRTGGFVKVEVGLHYGNEKDIFHTVHLPIMDYNNKSIKIEQITTFDINKAIQRALTKAIAMHGLGLYVYRGEDFPEDTGKKPEDLKFPGKQRSNNPNEKTMSNPKNSCSVCGKDITDKVNDYSKKHFEGISLCMDCQKNQKEIEAKQKQESKN